jgi:2-C-methyl-D-erythritol 4-phosphate cytidylyltransferase/2-C-methyl-D-erythritol 2,4-cyclodiphosphate synthase
MTFALIVAAGRGQRLSGPIPKQYRLLDGSPIIRHTVAAFRRNRAIDGVQVVIHPNDLDLYQRATDGLNLPPPLIGGNSRQESVRLGLEGIARQAPETIIIHDGVRPFVEQETISAVIDALDRSPCAIAGVPLADTLKFCGDDKVLKTVERTNLWRAQTPQAFRFADILAAHRRVYLANPLAQDFTDDAAIAEAVGLEIEMVRGTEDNFKITTEHDLDRAEVIMQRGHREIHSGWGFSTQNLVSAHAADSPAITICGIPIVFDPAVRTSGGSDVGLDAITSAILGTVGGISVDLADSGSLPSRRFANSENLIREAVSVVAMAGGRIEHIDLTVISDFKSVLDRRDMMIKRAADLLSTSCTSISIKHAFTDDIGFTFRRDVISTQCVATVNYPRDRDF